MHPQSMLCAEKKKENTFLHQKTFIYTAVKATVDLNNHVNPMSDHIMRLKVN